MNCVNIAGRAAVQIAAGAQSQPLTPGVYGVWAEADSYVKIGMTASDVTELTGYPVFPGTVAKLRIAKEGLRIGATAAVSFIKID